MASFRRFAGTRRVHAFTPVTAPIDQAHRIPGARARSRWRVGIAVSFLLASLQAAGLATLPYAPSPMGFLNPILGRPENERPFLLVAVGYTAPGAQVPALPRKPATETVDVV